MKKTTELIHIQIQGRSRRRSLKRRKKEGEMEKTKDNSKTRGKKKRHASVVKLFVFCVSRVLCFFVGYMSLSVLEDIVCLALL